MDDGLHIAQILGNGIAVTVKDRLFKNAYGTSWIVKQQWKGALYFEDNSQGVNVVPGTDKDQSSYRSKRIGIYGVLAFIACVCKYHHITTGAIELGCDGEQALAAIFEPNHVTSSTKHFDIIIVARKLVKVLVRKNPT